MKTCTKCLESKPLDMFYWTSTTADGRGKEDSNDHDTTSTLPDRSSQDTEGS